jgi:hypothetical protein
MSKTVLLGGLLLGALMVGGILVMTAIGHVFGLPPP